MKSYIFLLLLLVKIHPSIIAQDSSLLKRLSFRASIRLVNEGEIKGWLSAINDSSLLLTDRAVNFGRKRTMATALKEIDYSKIETITVKRNNGAGRGALYGGIIGSVIGVIGGLVSGSDPEVPASPNSLGLENLFRMTAGEKAVLGGVGGGLLGAGLGALIGNFVKMKFVIGGKKEEFEKAHLDILSIAYRNQ